jgi:TRAP-type C4-dicarboxylate transport system permease small subunit
MAEPTHGAARPTDPVGRVLFGLSRALAICGGFLCCLVALMVTVSVTGRYLFAAPIPGDYDLVGILVGCAIFAFLPYCQLRRANIVVDFFTTKAGARTKAVLDAAGSLVYLLVAAIFTWRLYFGMVELRANNEQIAAFAFYRWWTLPLSILCMIVLVAAVGYTLTQDIADAKAARVSGEALGGGE